LATDAHVNLAMIDHDRLKPRKLPRQSRSRHTVDVILAATARVLVDEGYDRASTNRIAEVAGVSVGSLYQYFPNKQSLVRALVEAHASRMLDALEASSSTASAPLEQGLGHYVDAMFAAYAVEPAVHRVIAQHARSVGAEATTRFEARAEAILRELLVHQPKGARALSTPLAVRLAVTFVTGVVERHLTDQGDDALRGELRVALVRMLASGLGG
jgi:AcrR family transcriptional regulator